MQASAIPVKFNIPFASAAGGSYIRNIPQASQIGVQNGAASLTDGFPPLTFVPVGSGGVPPFGQDFNGLLKQITQWTQWNNAGAMTTWDTAFATAVGGYPQGAFLLNLAGTGFWLCTVDNNMTNPDAAGAGWIPIVLTPSVAIPLMDGSGSAGSAATYARGDHRHPTDTTRLSTSYLSSDTGKVAAVVAPGFINTGWAPKFTDNQGSIGNGYAFTSSAGKATLTTGAHVAGHVVLAGDAAGSTVPGPVPSSTAPTLAAVSGATAIGNLPAFSDTLGTLVDSGFSPASLGASNDALKFQLKVIF